jgi:acetyl-CoA synthetase
MFVGIVNDTQHLQQSYITKQQQYITGDVAQLKNGYYRVTGRADDVLNVSGHRISTAQLEEAITSTPHVTESAVVGCYHPITGTAIYAFVVTQNTSQHTAHTQAKIRDQVALKIGHFVKPQTIQFVASLPKTRSGKILRRMLRAIANNQPDDLGDATTLIDPSVIQDLIDGHAAAK